MAKTQTPLLIAAVLLAVAVSGVAADVCYCSCNGCSVNGDCWKNFQAGYFDLAYGSCNTTACVVLFPNFCLINYPISATTGPAPGGISAGGIAGLVLLSLACLLVPLLMCYLYSRWKKQHQKAQDTVVETYKYEEKYGFNPYTQTDVKVAAAPVVAGGYTAPSNDPYASMTTTAAAPSNVTTTATPGYAPAVSSTSLATDLGSSSSLAKAVDGAANSSQSALNSATNAVNQTTASATNAVNQTTAAATNAVNQTAASATNAVNSASASATNAINSAVKP